MAKTEGGLTTVYHHDAAGRVIAETTPEGDRLRDYLYLGNKLVAVQGCMEGATSSGCSLRQWYHTDTLGSVLARTDASGDVVTRFDYKAFGEQATVTGVQGDRQYNGRVFDSGTGFHDYGARLYWPELGRFVSADSTPGNPSNPASLNRYSYVHNNPYKYVDPTGHFTVLPGIWGEEGGPLQWGAKWLAQKMADVSVDDRRSMLVRGGAAVLGTVASLFDAETNEKTGAVMGLAGSIKMVGGKAGVRDFDAARRDAFDKAGMTNPEEVTFSKVDPKTGTVVEFKGPGGAKVGYDSPHESPGYSHDTQHISWQSGGKRGAGAERGNIPYGGPLHPSRAKEKVP